MDRPDILTRRHTHSWDSDLTNSSGTSSSAEKYNIDEFDTNSILVYEYRGRNPLQTSSQKELCKWLDSDEKLRVTRKSIPRYTSSIDVKRHDLYLPSEKDLYVEYPGYDSSLASIKVPSTAYWSRAIFSRSYDELFIISPESSPNGSIVDSNSHLPSPTSSSGQGSEEDAKFGASIEE